MWCTKKRLRLKESIQDWVFTAMYWYYNNAWKNTLKFFSFQMILGRVEVN